MISNIMVGVDLSDTDDQLVEHAIFWANLFPKSKKIILFHNIRQEFLNDTLRLSEESIKKLITNILASIKERFDPLLTSSGIAYDVIVTFEPNSARAILNISHQKDVQLLIMGKKRTDRGTGIIAQSVLGSDVSKLTILLIPYGKRPQLNALVCSAELSASEKPMFEWAEMLNQLSSANKICLHVYRLPMAYFPYIDENNASLEMSAKKRAQERFKAFKKQINLEPDQWELALKQGVNIAETVAAFCKEHDLDLILIMRSAKATTAAKLGSNAKKLMRTSLETPLLVL